MADKTLSLSAKHPRRRLFLNSDNAHISVAVYIGQKYENRIAFTYAPREDCYLIQNTDVRLWVGSASFHIDADECAQIRDTLGLRVFA